ncbi:MAG: ATP-binding protein [Bacillota bacterium]
MYHFLPLPKHLNVQSFDRFLQEFRLVDGVTNVLSLRDLEFVDPYGLIGLFTLLRHCRRIAHRVGLYLPRSGHVLSYLRRSNLVDLAEDIAEILPQHKRGTVDERQEEWLLQMTPVVQEDDVSEVVAEVMDRVQAMLSKSLAQSSRILVKFCGALSELCQNIPQHSQDWGVVVVQAYRRADGERFVRLALGDLGIGLRGSLAERYPVDQWSESDVIRAAFTAGISRMADEGRGLGLAQVKATVQEMGGTLHIRSGVARVFIRDADEFHFAVPFFPGTQIAFELPERRDTRGSTSGVR